MLRGKKILVGITGSIAAYKAAILVRNLIREGADVKVVMTGLAKQFITPLTMATLSKNPILVDFFDPEDGRWNSHVSLGEWADAYVIAPATANTMAKMATGVADNLLLTTYLSARCPVLVAPAMDLDMFSHRATQRNIEILRRDGVGIVQPGDGELASGLIGKGRMAEPEEITDAIRELFPAAGEAPDRVSDAGDGTSREKKKSLNGIKVLVTAGPTVEPIDPVRYISNHSTGKMGYAIAGELARRGARVVLVSGPVAIPAPDGVELVRVGSAEEMYMAAMEVFGRVYDGITACPDNGMTTPDSSPLPVGDGAEKNTGAETFGINIPLPDNTRVPGSDPSGITHLNRLNGSPCDAAILCAAVADYTPAEYSPSKIKKGDGTGMDISLTKTKDIAAELGRIKGGRVIAGFALETDNERHNALDKLHRKNMDFIVLNSLRDAGAGFGHDTNVISIMDREGCSEDYPLMSKADAAAVIVDKLSGLIVQCE